MDSKSPETLEYITCENMRKNWLTTNNDDKTNTLYDLLWSNWYEKFNMKKDDFFVKLLKNFIMNEPMNKATYIEKISDTLLIIKGLDGYERKEMHVLCDKIGLHHESKQSGRKMKDFYIYKPEKWSWEYTIRNPYSRDPEYYERKNDPCCDQCGESTDQLLYYQGESYCEECLNNTNS